ncbi:MAG TPA: hypothetical protein VFJ85_17920, partial [Acidimicrobiales bacterium]|nr:hypothetical protein [Acidimicrobiales bacterium]
MKRHAAALALIPIALAATACGGKSNDAKGSGTTSGRDSAPAAVSPFQPAPPAGTEAIQVQPQSYNYSPAVMDDGDVIKAWWCSASSLPGQATDQIWYQEYNKTTK